MSDQIQLPVKHYTQLGYKDKENKPIRNLCAQAAYCGVVEALTPKRPGVVGMGFADGSLTLAWELVQMGNNHGLKTNWASFVTLQWMRDKLRQGTPITGLVRYMFLNPGHTYDGNHWITLTGFDSNGFFVNDPLRTDPVYVTDAVLDQSFKNVIADHKYLVVFPEEAKLTLTKPGINIDPRGFPLPSLEHLKPFGFVRFPFQVREYQNESLEDADRLYKPIIRQYLDAGKSVMIPLTHEIGLEGKGFNWDDMANEEHPDYKTEWTRFENMYVPYAVRIARRYNSHQMIFGVLNEQDSTRFGVRVKYDIYGRIFNRVYAEIKAVSPNAKVITGGYNSGAGNATTHFSRAKIDKTDGIDFHPYGVSAVNDEFDQHGYIQNELKLFSKFGLPLYISEYGVLGQPNAPVDRVALYNRNFLKAVNGQVVTAAWYGWIDGMDAGEYEGYGVADRNGVPKPALYKSFELDAPPQSKGRPMIVQGLGTPPYGGRNLRSEPRVDPKTLVRVLYDGEEIVPTEELQPSGKYLFRKIIVKADGKEYWIEVGETKHFNVKL